MNALLKVHYDQDSAMDERVMKARPVKNPNTDYKARARELKAKYPKILARLAE